MDLADYLPFWKTLNRPWQEELKRACLYRTVQAGKVVHNGSEDCVGLLLVTKGRLRAFTCPEDGRELTLYRLLERDLCLMSASCILRGVDFDITVEAETEASFYQISAPVYQKLMKESAAVANYTNEIMAARFSDVMWLLDQILNKRLDGRLAAFLLEEAQFEQGSILPLTHEEIARRLGSAREVVTRMLRYFQGEGMVALSRGTVELKNMERLMETAKGSLRG